jgi:hypothetical protein
VPDAPPEEKVDARAPSLPPPVAQVEAASPTEASAPREEPKTPEVVAAAKPAETSAEPALTPTPAETSIAANFDPNDPRHVNAARVARVMVADLHLYHKEAVELGIRQGDFFERNKEALGDIRATYESRITADVRAESDHLDRAMREFIAKKKKQWGLE